MGCNTVASSQEEMAEVLKELTPTFESEKLKAPEESTMSLISIDQAPEAYSGKIKRAVMVFD